MDPKKFSDVPQGDYFVYVSVFLTGVPAQEGSVWRKLPRAQCLPEKNAVLVCPSARSGGLRGQAGQFIESTEIYHPLTKELEIKAQRSAIEYVEAQADLFGLKGG